MLWLTYSFEREDVRDLMRRRIFWGACLQIVHAKAGYPKCIIFAPLRFSALQEAFGRYNYRTSDYDHRIMMEKTAGIPYARSVGYLAILAGVAGTLAAILAFAL